MASERQLAAVESELSSHKVPIGASVIAEKISKAKGEDIGSSFAKEIAEALNHCVGQNKKGARPRFLRFGECYGLGRWFKEWPPRIDELCSMILSASNRPLHITDLAREVQTIRALNEPAAAAVRLAILNNTKFVSFGGGMIGLHGWKKYWENTNDFHYSTPSHNWVVSQKLSELMEDAERSIKISCPYVDKSTFQTFLDKVPSQVEISLLVGKDNQLPTKVSQGLKAAFLSDWTRRRKLKIRRVDDLHSRFIVVDDSFALITSADLQKDQQQEKYQYLLMSSDPIITGNCRVFFETMWQDAKTIDFTSEISKIESSGSKTPPDLSARLS